MRARTALATALLALCVAVPAAAGQQRYAPAVAFDGATTSWSGRSSVRRRAGTSTQRGSPRRASCSTRSASRSRRPPGTSGRRRSRSTARASWSCGRTTAPRRPGRRTPRVSAAGLLLDPGGIPVSAAPGVQLEAAITGTGSGSLVVWTEGGAASDIRGARVSSAGAVLDPGGLTVFAGAGAQLDPAVAFGGAAPSSCGRTTGAARERTSTQRGSRAPARCSTLPASPSRRAPATSETRAVAVDGAAFLAAWDVTSDVQARSITATGALLGSGSFAVAAAPGSQTRPALAFDGANFLATWQDELDLDGVRVSPGGGVLVPVSAISTAPLTQQRTAVASGASELIRCLGGRARGRRRVGRLRCARFAGRRRPRRGRDPDSTGPRPTGAATAHHARPQGPQTARAATFRFRSSRAGSTFQCRLDRSRWRACRSPKTYRGLELRTHRFQVLGRDRAGNVDRSPRAGVARRQPHSGAPTSSAATAAAPGLGRCAATPSRSRTGSRSTAAGSRTRSRASSATGAAGAAQGGSRSSASRPGL